MDDEFKKKYQLHELWSGRILWAVFWIMFFISAIFGAMK